MRSVEAVKERSSVVGFDVQLRDASAVSIAHQQMGSVGPNQTRWSSQLAGDAGHFVPVDYGGI